LPFLLKKSIIDCFTVLLTQIKWLVINQQQRAKIRAILLFFHPLQVLNLNKKKDTINQQLTTKNKSLKR